jgi:hypothetical protein
VGAIAFILQRQTDKIGWHLAPLICFAIAAALIFYSWDLQKRKASRRYKGEVIPDPEPSRKGFNLRVWECKSWRYNLNIDRAAAIWIAVGAGIEIVLRFARV